MMDITMPAMSTFFTFMVPGLVGIYWIFRSLIGLLKQYIISRLMPLPKFTEEDYKAAEREMKGKQQQNVSRAADSGQVRAVRSLHYIDDEDFEDTRERGLARRAAIEEKQRAEQAKKAARSPFGQNAMKEDRKKNQKNKKDDGKTTSESNDTEN